MEFCRREGLSYSWFMTCQKKMLDEKKKGFERLETPHSAISTSGAIEFHYPDGRYFVFNPGTSVNLIRELVK